MDRNLALEFVRVTEAAAIAAAEWVGKGDGKAGNLKKMKRNLISFVGFNIFIVSFIVSLFFVPLISLMLFLLFFLYLILNGIKYSIKKKRVGALFYIPFLLFFKRFAYFVGVWGGLLR